MTVKELEQELGLSRASIRYYEKEGLIGPRRKGNGYREYSAQDIEELRRIQLLRRLGCPIEEIRRLQKGEADLRQALAEREDWEIKEAERLERMAEVCRRIREETEHYAGLDGRRYIKELEGLEEPEKEVPVTAVPYPVRRLLAREFDGLCCCLLLLWLLLLVFRFRPLNHYGLWILLICIGPEVLMLVIEPLLLTAWGTTPGKKIFGLAVRDRDGGRLTYREGFWRTMEVLVSLSGIYRRKKGIGYREYYRLCREGKQNSWEEGLTYRIRDRKPWRFAVFTVSCGVLVMLGVMISVRANKPAHLGNISRMEYYDNCNQLLEYMGYAPYIHQHLDSQGRWAEEAPNRSQVAGTLRIETMDRPDHQVTEVLGEVTAVTITDSGREKEYQGFWLDRELAVRAFYGAVTGQSGGKLKRSGLLDRVDVQFENWQFEEGGYRFTNRAAYRGYRLDEKTGKLYAIEGEEDRDYNVTFTIEKLPEEKETGQ